MGPSTWLSTPPGSAAAASCTGGGAGRLRCRQLLWRFTGNAPQPVLRAHWLLQDQDAGVGAGHSGWEALLPRLQAGSGRGPAAATRRHQAIPGHSARCLNTGGSPVRGKGVERSLFRVLVSTDVMGDGGSRLAGPLPAHSGWLMLKRHTPHAPPSRCKRPIRLQQGAAGLPTPPPPPSLPRTPPFWSHGPPPRQG